MRMPMSAHAGVARVLTIVVNSLVIPALLLVESQPAWAEDPPSSGRIRWRAGTAATVLGSSSDAAAAIARLATAQRTECHFVVQFDNALRPIERTMLRRAGLNLLSYLGDHAFLASTTQAQLDEVRMATLESLCLVFPLDHGMKLHPMLAGGVAPGWAICDERVTPEDRRRAPSSDTLVAACVLFHRDVPLVPHGVAIVSAHEATVLSRLRTVNGLVIELPWGRIPELADEDTVQWIEPPLPRMSAFNDSNRARVEADAVQAPWDRRRWDRPRCFRKGPCGAKAALALRRTSW